MEAQEVVSTLDATKGIPLEVCAKVVELPGND